MERRLTRTGEICLRFEVGAPSGCTFWFHLPRFTSHLLRLFRPDERRRQTRDMHKLHLWWVAAENDATVALLMRHASGFNVHGDDVVVCGPVLDQGVQGGCEVDGIVHINCSSSRVRHRHMQRQPAAASASPIPSHPPAPLKHSSSSHTGQRNAGVPFTSTSATREGKSLLLKYCPRP